MNRYFCIHGHFYQPPRENPWLEEIEVQDSASPYRDWNERISAECYSPNSASRIKSGDGRVIDIVNNYSKISFNFGPTLLSWMQEHDTDTYNAILEADKKSMELYSGHGSAIAQVYNHMIMPLSNKRDKQTQVIWGIEDFKYRFGRMPEGMWLAETAVDTESLETLAENGIKFTILAPRQASRIRAVDEEEWTDVSDASVDPKRAYLCNLPSGKSIVLFFYDGPISQELAFGDLLRNGENLANRMVSTFSDDEEPQLVHIATDGETYGHHSRHGDMALAYCLNYVEANQQAQITVYGEFLGKNPPLYEVEIVENTSWSCLHGVERWRSNCGCNTGREGWTQEWRGPLREALDWLRDNLTEFYEKELSDYKGDPWKLRDQYIRIILDRSEENREWFFSKVSKNKLSEEEKIRLLKLFEMQRHAMLMYTSCGWFFDEISGIETVQVIMYAGRAIQLARELGAGDFEPEFVERLKATRSNIPEVGSGAYAYEHFVKAAMVDLFRVAAHYAITSIFEEEQAGRIFSYSIEPEVYEKLDAGKMKMAIGRAEFKSEVTQEHQAVSFAVLHLGDHNLNGGVRHSVSFEAFEQMQSEVKEAFSRLAIADIILLLDKHFGTHNYSLWHLFKDERRKVFEKIMESTLSEIEVYFRQIYEHHYPIMNAMKSALLPLPHAISTAVEYVLNTDLRQLLMSSERIDIEKISKITDAIRKWEVSIDRSSLGYQATGRLNRIMQQLREDPENPQLMEEITAKVGAFYRLGLELDLWKAQNLLFEIKRNVFDEHQKKAKRGTKLAQKWMEAFHQLENALQVKF